MIVAPRFVFLHLHKSGGTFVNAALLRFIPGAKQVGYHLPRDLIPHEACALPVLGFVRNPWSFYVSWYAFQRARAQPNALFRVLSENGALEFGPTITRMLALAEDHVLLDRVVAALPGAYTNQGINLPAFALARIGGSGLGFYSFLHRYMHRPDMGEIHVGRMELLREELPRLLDKVQHPADSELLRYLHAAPAANTSTHEPYENYYDPALAARIARCDREVIEQFEYAFGS